MGHYWSEMCGDETPREREQAKAMKRVKALRQLPTSRFTVAELMLLTQAGWSQFKENYYELEWPVIAAMTEREGITK